MTKKHADRKAPDPVANLVANANPVAIPVAIPAADPAPDPAPPAPAAGELEQLRADAAKAAENWDKLLRATADFENFKKRAARERQEAITYANAALFQTLIPVLDNFEMALAATVGASE